MLFWFLLGVLLIGFDSGVLQELLQVLHSGQEKAALKAPDLSISQHVQILACLALLPASSNPDEWLGSCLAADMAKNTSPNQTSA